MNANPTYTNILVREVQRFRDVWWVMLLVFALAGLQWWIFIVQIIGGIPVGNNPGPDLLIFLVWLIFGVGFPAFFLWLHMTVEVSAEGVAIRLRPFANRTIPIGEISRVEPKIYRPVREFGGWGVRAGLGGRVAYNVSGDSGVELTLADGRRVLIGTRRAAELAGAIYKALGGQHHQF